ncbi:hypothetical protein FRB99_004727 [Tulasnella sp. 403]|nr:hypothetical protein FRB99_004727 [Tulasnella sp. 403]
MAPLIARPENEAALNEKAPVLTSFFGRRWVQYALSVLFVLATGFIAAVASSGTSDDGGGGNDEVLEWKSQTLGWISASLYIGSRIPQIIKNAQTKCAGLSLALFVFAVGGNLTFVLSILVASTSMKHLIANASWLAGSGLTIFLDFIVFWQFFHYRSENITNDDDEETA